MGNTAGLAINRWPFQCSAPPAKEYATNLVSSDLPDNVPSVVANQIIEENFPTNEGFPALLVFHDPNQISADEFTTIIQLSEWLSSAERPAKISDVVPFHAMPAPAKAKFLSEDGTSLLLPVNLYPNLPMESINETVTTIQEHSEQLSMGNMQLYITGPAGIASDSIAIFANADLVLLFSTIGLILILLVVIYRSPLLAIIPLLAAGFVYQVVDRLLGFFAKQGLFHIQNESLSIMMILLFAALTDYSMFIFSRFREELTRYQDKHAAMVEAMTHVSSPIFYSGGTVLVAMLTLFTALYRPYQNFAPVFSIAMVVILLAGLTLLPAIFVLFGRRAFWPFIPKLGVPLHKHESFWEKVSRFVVKKPWVSGGAVFIIIAIFAINALGIQYSFNMIKSFPADMNSRIGYEVLEQSFPKGELAPIQAILVKKDGNELPSDPEAMQSLLKLGEALYNLDGIAHVSLLDTPPHALPSQMGESTSTAHANTGMAMMNSSLSQDKNAMRFTILLAENPYDQSSLDNIQVLRDRADELLQASGFSPEEYALYYAGESAHQADVRSLNERDTKLVVILITLFITLMLVFQTRSLVAPIYMIATILFSFASAMGLGWFIIHSIQGIGAISYRIPLYAFVFLVALGVDYNIMLISRIHEEATKHPIKEAVQKGLALTGGVISSAGIILAATFAVLITQPLQELHLFGMIVSLGILMDVFLIRGLLVPSIITLVGKWNWWPSKLK